MGGPPNVWGISGMDLKNDENKSDFRLGSVFFGISDPGLVKKCFFDTFLSQKMTRAPGDEIWTESDFDRGNFIFDIKNRFYPP